nr:potassium channel family protein [Wenjunlia tyrosinilytica]
MHQVTLPHLTVSPLRQVLRRLVMALGVLFLTVLVVYADHGGYHDNADDEVSFLDSVYYATVTLSTTGYGDIVPFSDSARLINILVVTPLRVLFLIILVGTTLEVLTQHTREHWRQSRWRATLRDHTVVVGFGTKGRSAAQTLVRRGTPKDRVVVVDPDRKAIEAANAEGFAGVAGDATRSEVLLRAEAQRARQIVIAAQRDDTAVLVTLTARQINKGATIVAAVREQENAPLLRQSGADSVITTATAAGRLLGLSMLSPSVGEVMEDLITSGTGLDLIERPVTKAEAGRSPRECADLVIAVKRGNRLLSYDEPEAARLELTDRVITVRRAAPAATQR